MTEFTTSDEARLLIAVSTVPILVQFASASSKPFDKTACVVDELARDYEGRVAMLTIGIDEPWPIARPHDVGDLPAMLLFEGGAVLARFESAVTPGALSDFLDTHIGTA